MVMSEDGLAVRLVDIGKAYSVAGIEVRILSGINLGVSYGEFMSILGSYGSGRTCLLNIMGLISKPTSGKVFIRGKNVTKLDLGSQNPIMTDRVGFLSKAFGLVPELTVLENLELAFHITGANDFEERVASALSDVGMEGDEYRLARTLSALESRLLSIARNMAGDVNILVCDDPAAGLSTSDASKIADLLIKANREREISVIVGTPDKQDEFDIGTTVRVENGSLLGEHVNGISENP
jgi:putative ABC transport system ATP-binding protein